jgi:hypothetical protein
MEYFSAKGNLELMLNFIKAHCAASIASTEPTVYDTAKFKNCVEAIADDAAGSVKLVEAKPEFSAVDGRGDPNQPDVIRTASYLELEELIDPAHPINIYVTGETGLGKSTAIFAIGKKFNKPVIRVNMSGSTDIDDLIGGIRIVDGNTIFDPGPVAIAMEMGAILLLDECDAGKPQILIDLHPVLERKGVLAKKARKMIYPAPGFCVIATGNSKGSGDSTGKYIGVNSMNHAFMQRFAVMVEFQAANRTEIENILRGAVPKLPYSVLVNLCNWYQHVRESYESGSVSEYINARKMIDIATVCMIYRSKNGTDTSVLKALRKSLAQYEESTVEALVQLYDTIVEDIDEKQALQAAAQPNQIASEPSKIDEAGTPIPF